MTAWLSTSMSGRPWSTVASRPNWTAPSRLRHWSAVSSVMSSGAGSDVTSGVMLPLCPAPLRRPRVQGLSGGDDVHELRGPDDDRPHLAPVEGAHDGGVGQGQLPQCPVVDAPRYLQPGPHLAGDLHDARRAVLDQQGGVG